MKRMIRKRQYSLGNCEVKAQLFKRDTLKRKATKDWLLYRSFGNAANIALRCDRRAIVLFRLDWSAK